MKRNALYVILLIAAAVILAGCGGGGGGGGSSTTDPGTTYNFVLTGTVMDYATNSGISGVKVTIGSKQVTTNSQGRFTCGMDSRPFVTTYSVDGSSVGYFNYWAKADDKVQDATKIELPVAPAGGMDLGNIYIISNDSTPPPPVF